MTNESAPREASRWSRRTLLATGVAALSGVAGCLDVLDDRAQPASETQSATNGPAGRDVKSSVDNVHAALTAGKVVAIARERDAPIGVDPDTTETPIQDGLDLLDSAGGGELRLPPTVVFEAGPIRPSSDTTIVGFGPGVSEVNFPANTDGIRFESDPGVSRVKLDGFALNGPGGDADAGVAIRHSGNTQNLSVGRLLFWGWNNAVYRVEQGVGPFQCRHNLLTVYECDAGEEDGLFEFSSTYGPANQFGTIAAYPTATYSGTDSTAFFTRGGTQSVDHLTLGGTVGSAVHQAGDSQFHVGVVHWEPVDQRGVPEAVVRLFGSGPATVGGVKQVNGTARYIYEVGRNRETGRLPASKRLGPHQQIGTAGELRANVVNLSAPGDPSKPSFYEGVPSDVDVTYQGSETGGFRVLGDA